MKMLPCPFCGRKSDPADEDTMHPSGSVWKDRGEFRTYHHRSELSDYDGQVWELNCVEHYGGCGANMLGDSPKDVLDKWNRRETPLA